MFLKRLRLPSSTPAEMPNFLKRCASTLFSFSLPCTVACQLRVPSNRSRSATSSS